MDKCPTVQLSSRWVSGADTPLLSREPRYKTEEDARQLMSRVAARDESALAQIYDLYSSSIYSLLRRMLRDESAAEDILQDVFFQLWQIASRFDPNRGSLRGWLLVMARNRAISALRRRPQTDSEDIELRLVSPLMPQDTAAAQNELVSQIRSALNQLPSEHSKLFELAYFEGLSHSEIAQRTGQPLGTVKTRLRDTLANLRRVFQP